MSLYMYNEIASTFFFTFSKARWFSYFPVGRTRGIFGLCYIAEALAHVKNAFLIISFGN